MAGLNGQDGLRARAMEEQHYEVLLCGIPRRTGHVVLGRDYGGWRTRSLGDASSRSALSGMPDAAVRISTFRYVRCCEDGAARGREPSSKRGLRRDAPQRLCHQIGMISPADRE